MLIYIIYLFIYLCYLVMVFSNIIWLLYYKAVQIGFKTCQIPENVNNNELISPSMIQIWELNLNKIINLNV